MHASQGEHGGWRCPRCAASARATRRRGARCCALIAARLREGRGQMHGYQCAIGPHRPSAYSRLSHLSINRPSLRRHERAIRRSDRRDGACKRLWQVETRLRKGARCTPAGSARQLAIIAHHRTSGTKAVQQATILPSGLREAALVRRRRRLLLQRDALRRLRPYAEEPKRARRTRYSHVATSNARRWTT